MAEYQVHVPGMSAVGMHHWGEKKLLLNNIYNICAEPMNPADANAVAIYEAQAPHHKVAYLSRESAVRIQPILMADPPTIMTAKIKVMSEAQVHRKQ